MSTIGFDDCERCGLELHNCRCPKGVAEQVTEDARTSEVFHKAEALQSTMTAEEKDENAIETLASAFLTLRRRVATLERQVLALRVEE